MIVLFETVQSSICLITGGDRCLLL